MCCNWLNGAQKVRINAIEALHITNCTLITGAHHMRHCISSMLLLRLARGLRGPARPVARLVPTRAAASAGDWLGHRSDPLVPASGPGDDWIARIATDDHPGGFAAAKSFVPKGATLTHPPRILVLHGSLRETSFSRKLANEMARLLEVLGCEVRSFDPSDLPVRDPTIEDHPKVVELRALSEWSEGHVWVSPEMHGCITGAFKNQIDWLPLNTGSVRPTQGRTCVVLQVNGGSQSFTVHKSNCRGASPPLLNHGSHAIDATPARWRGGVGLTPLDWVITAASPQRNDLSEELSGAPDSPFDFHTGPSTP